MFSRSGLKILYNLIELRVTHTRMAGKSKSGHVNKIYGRWW